MWLTSQILTRARAIRWLALAVVCGLGVSAWGVAVWRTVSADVCIEPAGASLTLLEMGELRKTLRRHQAERSAPMHLSQDQMTFVLVDHLDYPVSFRLFGDRVEVFASVPTSRGCAHINYIGGLTVEGGSVSLEPEALRVGALVVPAALADWGLRRSTLATLGSSQDPFLRAVDRLILADGGAQVWLNTSERLW